MSMTDLIPFPTVKQPSTDEHEVSIIPASPAVELQESVLETQSSKLTSSDKLSALPTTSQPWRTHRHSLGDLETIRHDSWGTHRGRIHSRLSQAGSSTREASEGKQGSDTPKRISFESERGSLPPPAGARRGTGQASFSSKLGPGSRASDPSASPNPHSNPRPGKFQASIGAPNTPASAPLPSNASPPLSRPHSRAASPLRMFQHWSSNMAHNGSSANHDRATRIHRHAPLFKVEEPFIPVNPFKIRRRTRKKKKLINTIGNLFSPAPSPSSSIDLEAGSPSTTSSGAYNCEEAFEGPVSSVKAFLDDAQIFVTDSLPRQLYLNMLLRIPAMYFSRVARIFEDAEVSRPDIQRMIDAMCTGSSSGGEDVKGKDQDNEVLEARGRPTTKAQENIRGGAGRGAPDAQSPATGGAAIRGPGSPKSMSSAQLEDATSIIYMPLPFPDEWTPTSVSPSLFRFKHSWEAFIDSLIREWKTLNVVSALLSSAILSIFQVPEAAEDPVTRTLALLSLVSALMSLSYGCMYIVRFASMRSMFRASKWAEEARKTKTLIWWNVWVMLAMPAVWISWAMLFFLSAILSFVWRTGSENDPVERPPLSSNAALGPRIVITTVFCLGMVYLFLIINTLKRYGTGPNGSGGSAVQGLLRAGSPQAQLNGLSGHQDGVLGRMGSGGAGGEALGHHGHSHGLMLSRLRTPESDASTSEQRGRQRQRMEFKDSESKARSWKRRSTSKKSARGREVDDEEEYLSIDLKELSVVSVKLPDKSVDSL